ncbi:NB-ARC domain-containing protein [Streptomyces sp. NBC_00328]|uniref:NB-ARC domain-containing protein n=1 Tax=Streptomyces sp. NBC_00328 TaxID=2903646 RepID=UPI002E2D7E8E|nr:NB-ARC domain-containing protein [Streptomyces sp. NBC_00328]
MGTWRRWGVRAAITLCAAGGVWLLVVTLRHGSGAADPVASVWGSVAGLASLVVSLRPVPEPRPAVARPTPPVIPEGWVDRDEADEVMRAVLRNTRGWRDRGPVGITAGLHGAGGFGKTTLAKYVASRRSVQRQFPGGVHWITIGRDVRGPAAVAAKVAVETRLITGDTTETGSDPERAGSHLGGLLEQMPRTLLIIDDVWEREQLTPFLRGAEKSCVRLVTTRRPDVLPATRTTTIHVDRMTGRQAHALLTRRLTVPPRPDVAEALVKATGRWALLLGIANKFIGDQVATGADPTETAATLLHRLSAGGPAVQDPDGTLDLNDPDRRNTAVRASIQAATTLLRSDDAEQRFNELGIFAEDEAVPMALVTALWQATDALDETAARSLCKQMADLSLLAIDTTLPGGAITLHDVVRDYLRAELGTTGLAAAGTALLDATAATLPSAEDGGVAWWQTATGYLQDHLIEHLLDARRTTQAMAVAGDFRWMRARLHQRGPTAPWRDLDRVGAPAGTLARQLASAAHLLTPTTPPDALDAILLSRVPDALNRPTSPRPTDPPAFIDRWMPPDLPDPALLRRLTDDAGPVVASRDGAWLATRRHETVRIWDPTAGHALRTLSGHTASVTSMVVSPDGAWLATTSYDGTLRIWDPAAGRQLHRLVGHTNRADDLISLVVGPDGTWFATAGSEGIVRIWDPFAGSVLRTLRAGTASAGMRVEASPDGAWLATASDDRTVLIWDVATGSMLRALTARCIRAVTSMAASPDGAWLATASDDGTAQIWDVATGRVLHTLPVVNIRWVVKGSGRAWLATVGNDDALRVWDVATGQERLALPSSVTHGVTEVEVSPDASWLATTGHDGAVRLWDVATGQERLVLNAELAVGVPLMTVGPHGAWLATTTSEGTLRIWDTAPRQVPQRPSTRVGRVTSVAVGPNGAWVATASDEAVRIMDTGTGRRMRARTGHPLVVTEMADRVAVSPDGQWFTTAGFGGGVGIWDCATGEKLRTIATHSDEITAVAISADGAWLAGAGSRGTVGIWDPITGEQLRAFTCPTGSVTAVAISPDGTWLARADSRGTVGIWDPVTGQQLRVLDDRPGHTVAISPDGTWLVGGGSRGTVGIWDPATGQQLRTFEGHKGSVTAVAISPDGAWLAGVDDEGTLLIRSPMTGRVLTMMRTDSALLTCAWDPDGNGLIAGGNAGLFAYRLHLGP